MPYLEKIRYLNFFKLLVAVIWHMIFQEVGSNIQNVNKKAGFFGNHIERAFQCVT